MHALTINAHLLSRQPKNYLLGLANKKKNFWRKHCAHESLRNKDDVRDDSNKIAIFVLHQRARCAGAVLDPCTRYVM